MFLFSSLLNRAREEAAGKCRGNPGTGPGPLPLDPADSELTADFSTQRARSELDEQMKRLNQLLETVESREFDRNGSSSLQERMNDCSPDLDSKVIELGSDATIDYVFAACPTQQATSGMAAASTTIDTDEIRNQTERTPTRTDSNHGLMTALQSSRPISPAMAARKRLRILKGGGNRSEARGFVQDYSPVPPSHSGDCHSQPISVHETAQQVANTYGSSAACPDESENQSCSHEAKPIARSDAGTTGGMEKRCTPGLGNGTGNLRICNRLHSTMTHSVALEPGGQPSHLAFATPSGTSIAVGLQWPDVLAFLGGALVVAVLALIATDYTRWF